MEPVSKHHSGVVLEVHSFSGKVADIVDRYTIEISPTRRSVVLVRQPRDLLLSCVWTLFCLLACPAYVYLQFLPPETADPLWERAIEIAAMVVVILLFPTVLQLHKLRRTRLIQLVGGDVAGVGETETARRPLILNETCHVPWPFGLVSLLRRVGLQARIDLRSWVYVPAGYNLDYFVKIAAKPRQSSFGSIFAPVRKWLSYLRLPEVETYFPVKGEQLLSFNRLTVFGPHTLFRFGLIVLLYAQFGQYGAGARWASVALLFFVGVLPMIRLWLLYPLNVKLGLWEGVPRP